MRAINLTDYHRGLDQGRDDAIRLSEFIQDMLEEERHYWNNFPSEYGRVSLIDKIASLIDSYMDDLKEGWNA